MLTANFQHFDDFGMGELDSHMNDMQKVKKNMAAMAKSGGLNDYLMGESKDSPSNFIKDSLGVSSEDISKIVRNLMFPKKDCAVGDDDCESKKKDALLGTRYSAAQRKYKQAKIELDQVIKEKEDKPAVRKALHQEAISKGELRALEMVEARRALSDSVQQGIDLSSTQDQYGEQTADLMMSFAEGAEELEGDIAEMENKRRVADRKTYYEVQQIETYRGINWWLSWIYWLAVASLVCLLLYKYAAHGHISDGYFKLAYVCFFIAYPFIMDTIIKGIMYVLNILFGRIPDNVYMSP
jgi:hypothetical protein